MSKQATQTNKIEYLFAIEPPSHISVQLQPIQKMIKQDFQNDSRINDGKLLQWYLDKIINRKQDFPKICILKAMGQAFQKCISQPKILNQIYLQQESIQQIIRQADNLVDIGFALRQYVSRKVMMKKVQYSQLLNHFIFEKINALFQDKSDHQIDELLRIKHIKAFFDSKQKKPKQICEIITPFLKNQLTEQISLIFKYVFTPLFHYFETPKRLKENMYRMTFWLTIIDDWSSTANEILLYRIALAIKDKICHPMNERNLQLIRVFAIVIDVLSVNYFHEDNMKHVGLAPLLNMFTKIDKFREVVVVWNTNHGVSKQLLKDYQAENLFRNSMHTGSNAFTLYLIYHVSNYLKTLRKYDVLFHIFQSFIRKDYIKFKLPNKSFLNLYLEMIFFYAVGFINRDRFDGEAQLDELTKNLQYMLFRPDFNFDQHAQKIILFYKIYQYRFVVLSQISKKFMEDLQSIYHKDITASQVHTAIGDYRFYDDMADQIDGYIPELYQLKKSQRYLGITNMGNICYMSSFMQALFMTKKFKGLILEARDSGKISSRLKQTQALISLFTELTRGNFSGDREVDPIKFKEVTPQPFRSSWDQHDTGQFGRMYIDSLTRQLKGEGLKDQIQKLFYNKIESKIICKRCSNQNKRNENMLDFILNIDKKAQNIYVSELLKAYFKGEQLDLNNLIYCERCRKKTQVHSITQPIQFPQYIINTISIFQYSGGGKKIIKPFQFQFQLNFKNILPDLKLPDITYTLYAFIVHLGSSAQRGHYICFARNIEENPMIWYSFDDAYVTQRQINKSQDFNFGENQTPYILFYSSSRKSRISVNNTKELMEDSIIRKNSINFR